MNEDKGVAKYVTKIKLAKAKRKGGGMGYYLYSITFKSCGE